MKVLIAIGFLLATLAYLIFGLTLGFALGVRFFKWLWRLSKNRGSGVSPDKRSADEAEQPSSAV